MRKLTTLGLFVIAVAISGLTSAAPPTTAPSAGAKATTANPLPTADEPVYVEDARCRLQDAKQVATLDSGYPCCTKCTNCRLECVATDASGNCTRWKYNCDCERWCPCPRSR